LDENPKTKQGRLGMKIGIGNSMGKVFIILNLILAVGLFTAAESFSAEAKEIDASVDVALDRFYKDVKGAKEFAKTAKALLVLPGVTKGGFVFAGEYGEGALRIGGKTVDYYNIASASFGLTIGAQKKDIIIAFMTDEALKQFRATQGWEAGVDGNLALWDIGAGTRLDTTTMKDPIVAFVFDSKGFMADLSLKGAKITKLDKSKEK
jgi:lipid-binding SYLF domain-containing protein